MDMSILLQSALKGMLVFSCEVHHLGHFGFSNFTAFEYHECRNAAYAVLEGTSFALGLKHDSHDLTPR